jgi:DNA-directed RNA polymerase specialized sigma24 family protein
MVWEALNQVPRKSRQALILRYFGGLSYPEMAQALGCAVSTAKSRVAYGHQTLARLLGSGAEAALGYCPEGTE